MIKRLWISAAVAFATVITNTILTIVLTSHSANPTGVLEIVSYALAVPLAPGFFLINTVFGEYRAVHGGQIAVTPPLSALLDTVLIFGVWEFVYRKRSKELAPFDKTLHIQ
jgi:hypothetical protein